jgi:hypothetical protein
VTCVCCGGGDKWIKTCRAKDGSHLCLCDSCYEALKRWFVIVPGDWVVMARCDLCWRYGNPREFVGLEPGGRKDTYSGTCASCAREEGR